MVKSFSTDTLIRDEYYRDHNFAIDLIDIGTSTPTRVCSGFIDVEYLSNTYSAQGEFMGYSPVQEDFEVKLNKVTIQLSALPTNYFSRFASGTVEGSTVKIYKAFLDLNTLAIVQNTPILLFQGEVYNVIIQEQKNTATIGLEVSSVFADFERSAGRKTNNWENWRFQDEKYDTAFEQAGYIGQTEFMWGRVE